MKSMYLVNVINNKNRGVLSTVKILNS